MLTQRTKKSFALRQQQSLNVTSVHSHNHFKTREETTANDEPSGEATAPVRRTDTGAQ